MNKETLEKANGIDATINFYESLLDGISNGDFSIGHCYIGNKSEEVKYALSIGVIKKIEELKQEFANL